MTRNLDEVQDYIKKLCYMKSECLTNIFSMEDKTDRFVFYSKLDQGEWIMISKERDRDYSVPVNASLCNERTLGSNNYVELIEIAEKLVKAYHIQPTDYMENVFEWGRKEMQCLRDLGYNI